MKTGPIIRVLALLTNLAVCLMAEPMAVRSSGEQTEAASIIAKCAEAMGGAARIKDIRALRAEVVYPDHGPSAVLHEIRRPNMIRTERPGEYIAIFDGKSGAMLKYDPSKPGQAPVPQDLPPEAAKGFETDLVWLFPGFFDFPAEYAGIVESDGTKCHKLITRLPLGTRAEYLIDSQTSLIKKIAVDETFQGQTFHMEREWLDLKPTQGILFPSRMTYPGRGGKTATAELKKVEFNPVLSEDRFRIPGGAPQEYVRIPEIPTAKIENMVDVGGRKLDCCVYGSGSPTVVLVSGFEAPQVYWNPVIPDLAAKSTVVTYDRAGVGKSEIGDLPAHGEQSAKDLHVLLDKWGVPRPYILVGHSYGGSVVRLFASLYPDDMGGLILEDTQHEDVLKEMQKILKGKDLEAFDQLVVDRFGAPENPKTEGDYRNVTREQVGKSKPLPRIPFVILTSADRAKAMGPMFSDEAIEKMAELDRDLNNKLASLIPGGRQIIVEGAGHNIHIDKPEVLIAPVVEMIKQVREKKGN